VFGYPIGVKNDAIVDVTPLFIVTALTCSGEVSPIGENSLYGDCD
jgi:hypothetical protein